MSHVVAGISADLHDAAACVVVDGNVVAAAEEERFTRHKHEPALPRHALAWCLEDAGVGPGDLDAVAFHDKPFTTYERILLTHARVGPRGFGTLGPAVAAWSRSKLWVRARIDRELRRLGHGTVPLTFAEHHVSHAAAAFHPSPFDEAAVLTMDGVGEWATSSIGVGRGNRVELLREMRFPDSIGLLYSTITAHCGFAVNDGEYKLMGLAPFGEPTFAAALREHVVKVRDDGTVELDQRWFDYRAGSRMAHPRLSALLGGDPRPHDAPLGQREADLAASMQEVLEDVVLKMATTAKRITGATRLCLAGGVALNCVANARLLRDGPFDDLWIQPAAGDAGSSIGAALWNHHDVAGHPRHPRAGDGMAGCLLGPAFDDDEVRRWLPTADVRAVEYPDRAALCRDVATALDEGAVVGWFQGRMEFGPRALGSRSILADPRRANNVARINAAVKGREGFRPFAPAVLEERAADWFELDRPSPYMLRTVPVHRRLLADDGVDAASPTPGHTGSPEGFAEMLGRTRSTIPACTHVDGSARVQTVSAQRHPAFHQLLAEFEQLTGCPVLLNTSFNGRDEPIVRSPADAVRCFRATGLDALALGPFLIRRDAEGAAA